jgi:hypothetical protein
LQALDIFEALVPIGERLLVDSAKIGDPLTAEVSDESGHQ